MYLATLSKHVHVNSSLHYDYTLRDLLLDLIKSITSFTHDSLSGSKMSTLVNPMTRDCLDTNIITHDRNLIIMISS